MLSGEGIFGCFACVIETRNKRHARVWCLQALETRIQKNIAKKGDSIKLKPVSAQKVSAHKSHQSPTK